MLHVAWLRAINMCGKNSIKMDRLRELFGEMGATRVSTFIASGNVVFDLPVGMDSSEFCTRVEACLGLEFGRPACAMIRSYAELLSARAARPAEWHRGYIGFLSESPDTSAVAAMDVSGFPKGDELHVVPELRCLFLRFAQQGSKLTPAFVERRLGPLTTRNLRTLDGVISLCETVGLREDRVPTSFPATALVTHGRERKREREHVRGNERESELAKERERSRSRERNRAETVNTSKNAARLRSRRARAS